MRALARRRGLLWARVWLGVDAARRQDRSVSAFPGPRMRPILQQQRLMPPLERVLTSRLSKAVLIAKRESS